MNPIQEMIATLFSLDVMQQAKNQCKLGVEITPVEKFDMSFRLFKVDSQTINLEMMVIRKFGPIVQRPEGRVQAVSSYFKPIGVYKINSGFSKTAIIILKEFENDYLQMSKSGSIKTSVEVETLSLMENAVIGAFSMDAVIEARDKRDKSFAVNGLDVDIFMAHDGYPQMFLDDKYNINGPIAAYFIDEPDKLYPMMSNKVIFDNLLSRKLLSAYKWV